MTKAVQAMEGTCGSVLIVGVLTHCALLHFVYD